MGQTPRSKYKEESALDITYHEIYKSEKNTNSLKATSNLKVTRWLRAKLVKYALEHGIRPAQREFNCSINTVRLWVSRKDDPELIRFKDRSKRPKTINNQTAPHIEKLVLDCHEKERMGGRNLKHQYNLPVSEITAYRILKRNNKVNKRKKKHIKSQDLRKLKALQKMFAVVQVDAKILSDICNFYPYYSRYQLPLWQFTFTCEKSGATFYAYCRGETSIAACTFIVYVLEHLKKYGIKVKRIKTDKGSFAVARRSLNHTAFQKLVKDIYKIEHKQIVHKNQNADVERFHGLIEQYFYSICHIQSKLDFYTQARDKQIWFNYIRKNSGKNWQTPLEILKKDYPNIDPQVLALAPMDLDKHSDIYYYKLDPNYKPLTFESFFKDVPKEYLNNIHALYQYVMKLDDRS